MNTFYFGAVCGLFLYFAGQRFAVVALKMYKERKANEAKKAEENMKKIVNEIVNKQKGK